MSEYKELSCLAYDLRKKVVEMVVSGKGGHIGGDMSVIDVLVALYFKEMNISPENMDDPDRDRFVMSKGHSVEAYYAVLAAKGFFPMEEVIEKLRDTDGLTEIVTTENIVIFKNENAGAGK